MKTQNLILALLISFLLPALAQADAESKTYVRLSGIYVEPGSGDIGDALDSDFGALLSVGQEYIFDGGPSGIQFDFEIGWVKLDGGAEGISGSLKDIPLLVSARYVYRFNDKWSIAAGPSLGISYLKASLSIEDLGSGSASDWVFTYGLGAILSYSISDTVSIDAGYRYLWHDDADFDGVEVTDIKGHVFQVGVRLNF